MNWFSKRFAAKPRFKERILLPSTEFRVDSAVVVLVIELIGA
jgi:hypothetical protein